MLRRFTVNIAILYILIDAALVLLAMVLAVKIRPQFNPLEFVQFMEAPIQMPAMVYLLAILVWSGVMALLSVYDGRRNLLVIDELTNLTLAVAIAFVSLAGVLFLSYRDVSRLLYLIFGFQAYLYLLIWRVLVRLLYQWRGRVGVQTRRVLIIGAGTVGNRVREQLVKYPYFGLQFIGFLDDDERKRADNINIFAPLEKARDVIKAESIDDVVLTLPRHANERANLLIAKLHDLPIKVWVVPDYFSLTLHQARVEDFAGIPLLDLRAPALNDYQRLNKRAFDLIIGILLLPPVLILMFLITLAIWITDPGPVIFRQTRLGENGRLFKMYKFRTMIVGAEEIQHTVEKEDEQGRLIHKIPDDPRVTRIGKFLRRSSLDELPQLFNVLKGNMSLVGPRPEMPHLVANYQHWQRKRFAVPQGITGWWQIHGRSDKPMHLHTEDDLYYVQNYSMRLDLYILFKTIWVILRREGAY
ncbi:MAG: sugar transferase [Anaerolineales bacterium]|nr:sugar transferase [Chloroflexota bacterium]MBL6982424.1 sugar transferase [Anaerolineales bacterium]